MKAKILALLVLLTVAFVSPAWAAGARGETPKTSSAETTFEKPRVAMPRGPALGSTEEERRYAAREAKSEDAKKYRAGDVLVISGTAIAIILLVIVILILI